MPLRVDRLRRRAVGLVAVTATLGLLAGGCSTGPGPEPTPSPTVTESRPPAAIPVVISDSAAGRATRWVLDQLAAATGPSAPEAEAAFAQVFLDAIAAQDIAGVFDQLRALGPYTVTGYAEGGGNAETQLTGVGGNRFTLSVSTDADELIQGLFLAAAPDLPEIGGIDDVAGAIDAAAQDGSFLLARVSGDGADATCEPIRSRAPDTLRPVGSVFKLYVLGAVVRAVADGRLAWEDTLTLTEDLRSLPSGRLQDEPAGTQVSVRQAAEAMIAISDNTATDLLVDAVGRAAVEEEVAVMGHAAPEVLTPFITTREMFQLAFGSATSRDPWTAATGSDPLSTDPQVSDRQRAVVEALPGGLLSIDETLFADPAWPLGLDWFATASDVCRAHLWLQHLAATDAGAPVRAILSLNPGLGSPEAYDYVGFKGGSAPGEIAGSWYVESGADSFVMVLQVAAGRGPVPDGAWLVAVGEQALALAAG